MDIVKNRNRDAYSFANINLLGRCNADCYFCLGKDIKFELAYKNHLQQYYVWRNFRKFLEICKDYQIKKLYITGQTADSLQYKYLDALVKWLQDDLGFIVGIRTNGYLAEREMNTIIKMKGEIGYSIHTLNPHINERIMCLKRVPNWDKILPMSGNNVRVATVINRFNYNDIYEIMSYVAKFHNVKYIQLRRVSTDTRLKLLQKDIDLFEQFHKEFSNTYHVKEEFCGAPIYEYKGLDVVFWRTVETTVNSLNYFTDGTISNEYFVVEGYLKNMVKEVK
jgi:MoaA/NifB/PqqE/SkfB family radical SAM enzyme